MLTRHYTSVIVACGHHWDPLWPKFKGNFTGDVSHSHGYRTPKPFVGKRVMVIGGGNSGAPLSSTCEHCPVLCSCCQHPGATQHLQHSPCRPVQGDGVMSHVSSANFIGRSSTLFFCSAHKMCFRLPHNVSACVKTGRAPLYQGDQHLNSLVWLEEI